MAVAKLTSIFDHEPPSNEDLTSVLAKQREAFRREGHPSYAQRMEAIEKVHRQLLTHQDALLDAISSDYGNRSRHETLMAEIFITVNSIKHTKKHLRSWMRPRKAPISWQFKPGKGRVYFQPKGVAGIISPWNYPLQLAIVPLVQALSAGNRVMIKPSELTPTTSALMGTMLAEVFDPEEVAVINGGPEVGEAFSKLPFDHLFYTGSTKVGRLIMKAAAENLTPVTLELGGKSPCIVGPETKLKKAVPSIASGKLLNAGQTCVAPDYTFVPKAKEEEFVQAFKKQSEKMYKKLGENDQYTSIISDAHYDRIQRLIEDARENGARVIEFNPMAEDLKDYRKIPPTLVLDVTEDMDIMHEEIFGPVMPIKTYEDLEEAVAYINEHPRPLALYYYGNDSKRVDDVIDHTISGGACINDTLFHLAQEELPFGGIGPSGMGNYHGFAGFKTFSHEKSVFYQSRFASNWLFRAPYGWLFNKMVNALIGKPPKVKAAPESAPQPEPETSEEPAAQEETPEPVEAETRETSSEESEAETFGDGTEPKRETTEVSGN